MTVITSSLKPPKIPTGPKTHPFIQTITSIFAPFKSLEVNYQKYGDIYSGKAMEFASFVVLSNPQAIQQVLTADPNLFEVGKVNWIVKPLLGENSLVLLDGKEHKKKAQVVNATFSW